MRVTVLLLTLFCVASWAASNAAPAPKAVKLVAPAVASPDVVTIPQMLSYQGKLTDTLGVPVGDTTYQVAFRLYTVATGGASFWNETQTVRTHSGLFSTLLGSVAQIESVPSSGNLYLGMAVAGGAELSPRLRLVGSAYSFLAGKSANADLLQGELSPRLLIASAAYAYLSNRAADADLLQGKDTTALDARYVNEGQASSVTSNMIVDGTIAAADLGQMGAATGQVMKWTGSAWAPRNDSVGSGGGSGTVRKVVQASGVVCSPNPITDSGTVRFDSTWGDARYVNEAQTAGGDLTGTYPNPTIATGAVTSAKILDGTIAAADLAATGVTAGTYGSATQVSQVTVNNKGQVTGAANVTITGVPPGGAAGGDLTGTYPNPTIATSAVTTAKIADTNVTMAKLAHTGATTGQVLKWTGSAWAPRNDSMGSGTMRKVVQTTGVVCSPNPITDSGTVGFDTTWGDNRFINVGESAGGVLTGTYPNPALNNSGVTAGTYGSATEVGQFTVNAKGRLTSASNVTITGVPPGGSAGGDLTGTYPNPTIATGAVTSAKILDGTIAAADLGQMGAASGQVMKWTGSAWAPRNDSVGAGTVRKVVQATGVVCSPNPIIDSGTVRLDTTYSDGRYIKNQFTANQTASWRITGQGRCTTATASAAALYGVNTSATGWGVRGAATSYPGVSGVCSSTQYSAVEGTNNASSAGGYGVEGWGSAAIGVFGISSSNTGVYGKSTSGNGVVGVSSSGYGAYDSSNSSCGIYGASASADGVYGTSYAGGNGVEGRAVGSGYANTGVFAVAESSSDYNCGLDAAAAYGGTDYGAWCVAHDGSANYGVYSEAYGGSDNFGVEAFANGANTCVGTYGQAGGSGSNYGVYGKATGGSTNYAGYFNGDVKVLGNLSKGGGSFEIDHPLDPLNKYLYHSFVESPDMKNVYDGETVLDATGRATVELPDYFSALNRDTRIQLTGVGSSDVYVAQKVTGNQFVIGGKPGTDVYWQVTGIRQDPYANKHRIQVEVDKPVNERGKYIHPDAYGLPADQGIGYMAPPAKPAHPVGMKHNNPPVAPAGTVSPSTSSSTTTAPAPKPSSAPATGVAK